MAGGGECEGEGRGARGRRGGVDQHLAPLGAQLHLAAGVLLGALSLLLGR